MTVYVKLKRRKAVVSVCGDCVKTVQLKVDQKNRV